MVIDFIKKAGIQADIFKNEYPDKMPEYEIFKNEMKSISDEEFRDLTNPQFVITYLNDLIELYNNIKDAYLDYYRDKNGGDFIPEDVLVDKAISLLYFRNSGVYNIKDNYSYKTPDALMDEIGSKSYVGASSKFTFGLYVSLISMMKNKDNKEVVDRISKLVEQLLYTVANIFHPSVVAYLIELAITNTPYLPENDKNEDIYYVDKSTNLLKYLLKDDYESTLKSLFETLVIREGKFLASRLDYTTGLDTNECGVSYNNLVFNVLSKYIIKSYKEILDDSNQNNWVNTILSNPVYDKFRKRLYTMALCNLTVYNTDGEDETINACRYLREKVTEWIKYDDLSKRPNVPEPFDYIDIATYLQALYSYSMYHVGDVEITVNKFDDEIRKLEVYIENPENKDKDLDNEKEKIKKITDRKKHYLTLKSLIGFLFLEILSNEKICDKVYTPELVLYIMMNEPGIDNAMHDTHSAIMALYSKRDFKPLGTPSNNPFFIHYGEGNDVASPEAKYIAKLLSGITHYNMSSRVVASSAFTFKELGNSIFSVGSSFAMYGAYFSNLLKQNFDSLTHYITEDKFISDDLKKEVSNVCDDIRKKVSNNKLISMDDMEQIMDTLSKTKNTITERNEKIKQDKDKFDNFGVYEECYCDSLYSAIDDYMDTSRALHNIYNVLDKIIKNSSSGTASDTYIKDKAGGKQQYSLWPRIVQYEYPIVKSEKKIKTREETHHDNYMDLEPGDITSGYYKDPKPRTKSRYTTTKGC